MNRWLIWAPFLLLGPVTGPLSAGMVFYARRHRWGMASLCGGGIAVFWVVAPMILGAEVALVQRFGGAR
jgi:hypothetical protein